MDPCKLIRDPRWQPGAEAKSPAYNWWIKCGRERQILIVEKDGQGYTMCAATRDVMDRDDWEFVSPPPTLLEAAKKLMWCWTNGAIICKAMEELKAAIEREESK